MNCFRESSLAGVLAAALLATVGTAQAVEVRVTIENLTSNSVAVTPLWVGFHNGSFDSYNNGLSSQPGLERLAEDGGTSAISADFLAGLTYINNLNQSATVASSQPGADRVDGTLASDSGPPPIQSGGMATKLFTIDIDGSNRYFSYASMVIPTNDFFVANGNPLAHDLMSLYDGEGSISFLTGTPGTVNDAGTEEEDFAFTAGNPLFPGRGLPAGQAGPNMGPLDATTVIQNVGGDPFAGFLNAAGVDLTGFNFNQLAGSGIARITITAVPEPGFAALVALGGIGFVAFKRRRIR